LRIAYRVKKTGKVAAAAMALSFQCCCDVLDSLDASAEFLFKRVA